MCFSWENTVETENFKFITLDTFIVLYFMFYVLSLILWFWGNGFGWKR
jgi:hypothetical protein